MDVIFAVENGLCAFVNIMEKGGPFHDVLFIIIKLINPNGTGDDVNMTNNVRRMFVT